MFPKIYANIYVSKYNTKRIVYLYINIMSPF